MNRTKGLRGNGKGYPPEWSAGPAALFEVSRMTAIDWLIVALALALAPLGFRRGVIVGVLALAGFVLGAVVGSRLGPLVLEGGSSSPYAPATALGLGLVIGAVAAVLLEDVGIRIRARFVRDRVPRAIDGVGGIAVTSVLVLAIVWVLGAVALNAPALSEVRDDVQRSTILGALNDAVPPSGPILNVLNRIEPTPTVNGPSADVPAPRGKVLSDPEFVASSESAVRIVGTACGLGISGSGWVAAPGMVVTNAHVIAGEKETEVELRDGSRLEATPVAYQPRNDIAVLRVDGLDLPALELAEDPRTGAPGGIVGYPGEGSFSTAPARLGTTGRVRSQDSYGRGPIEREMTSFRGKVTSGNSGGPVIDRRGRVLTTVFASSLSSERPEGLGVPNAIVAELLERGASSTGTGRCN